MKALFLTFNLKAIGGMQEYNKNILKALNKLDFRNKIIELKKSNIWNKFYFILNLFLNILIFKPNIIFCAHINFSPLCFFIKKIFGLKYIIFTHGTEVWDIKNNLKLKSLKFSDKIISVSLYTKEKIQHQINFPEEKFFILPNVVDDKKFFPKDKSSYLLERHNLSQDFKIIFTLCRLSSKEQYKGYDKVIEALPEIIKIFPNTKYILGGKGDQNEINRVRQLINKLNLKNTVILTGEIADNELNDYYNLCDVFIMPSKGEGFGIVFIEALACGKIVIAGNKDASKEAILNGELGILVDPDNIIDIKNTILDIFNKKIDKRFFNKYFLREKVLENFSYNKFEEKFKVLINNI